MYIYIWSDYTSSDSSGRTRPTGGRGAARAGLGPGSAADRSRYLQSGSAAKKKVSKRALSFSCKNKRARTPGSAAGHPPCRAHKHIPVSLLLYLREHSGGREYKGQGLGPPGSGVSVPCRARRLLPRPSGACIASRARHASRRSRRLDAARARRSRERCTGACIAPAPVRRSRRERCTRAVDSTPVYRAVYPAVDPAAAQPHVL
jgi:hypothetical protein